jgi:hypothetical protein
MQCAVRIFKRGFVKFRFERLPIERARRVKGLAAAFGECAGDEAVSVKWHDRQILSDHYCRMTAR